MINNTLMSVKNLYVKYEGSNDYVLKNVSIDIPYESKIGIIGESGSGKSTLALAIAKLLPKSAIICEGELIYKGNNLQLINKNELKKLRGKEISIIYQDSQSSLDPLMKIGKQIEEFVKIKHKINTKKARLMTKEILENVGFIDVDRIMKSYCYEISGGMRQRVLIAIANVANPNLLIADEPTTALDVTTESKIINLLKKLQYENRSSMLMISHDLGVIKEFCDYIYVMKDGEIVESGEIEKVMKDPINDYTKHLISIMKDLYFNGE